ncbi:hypothetical protein EVAR_37419_1 [Eumeta japonica]|uniref:Uncharacterized protein n=1 Tax=Eumeta variegata TaxID=151549 RepID=A0A4C1WHN1_EUMVA|nr:hypothetical protein EVAR_37419_1 [Eumeta japonica]
MIPEVIIGYWTVGRQCCEWVPGTLIIINVSGPDKNRSHHLKKLRSPSAGDNGRCLQEAITRLINFSLSNHNMPELPSRQWHEIGRKATLERLLKEAPDATNKPRLRAALTSEYAQPHHHVLNDIIRRALIFTNVPSTFKTPDLSCSGECSNTDLLPCEDRAFDGADPHVAGAGAAVRASSVPPPPALSRALAARVLLRVKHHFQYSLHSYQNLCARYYGVQMRSELKTGIEYKLKTKPELEQTAKQKSEPRLDLEPMTRGESGFKTGSKSVRGLKIKILGPSAVQIKPARIGDHEEMLSSQYAIATSATRNEWI